MQYDEICVCKGSEIHGDGFGQQHHCGVASFSSLRFLPSTAVLHCQPHILPSKAAPRLERELKD
jgi:hypothetical protein